MEQIKTAKTILLIDDDTNIRLVFKKLFTAFLINVKIFTSDKGSEGLGLAYILKPNIIILDTTLPKYSGREVIEFIITNNLFANTRIVVLIEENDISNLSNLGANYTVLSKKDSKFLDSLFAIIAQNFDHRESDGLFKFKLDLGNKVISFANSSDTDIHRLKSGNGIFTNFYLVLSFIFNQALASVYLTIFLLLLGRKDEEETLDEHQEEFEVYRSRVYPTYILAAVAIIIVILLILIVLS